MKRFGYKSLRAFLLFMIVMLTLVGCSQQAMMGFNRRNIENELTVMGYKDAISNTVLVNQYNKLPADFSPSDLVLVNVMDFHNNPNTNIYLREEAAIMAKKLFQAASTESGLSLLARSGYRSYQTQAEVHERFISAWGQEEAQRFSARPGHSEHQLGLALDVTANSVNGELVQEFGQTLEGIWLRENAHRFGFIISYPEGREEETGFAYEPWHIRFVGIESATVIHENGWILEQYKQ